MRSSYRKVPEYHPELQQKGIIYFLSAWLFLTINTLIVKMLHQVPVSVILLFMNGVSLLLFLPFMFKEGLKLFKTEHLSLIGLRSFSGFISFACMLIAARHIPLVDSVLLSNTGPLFIPFIAFLWFKTPINHKLWWSIGVGFIGIICILKPGSGLIDIWSLVGLMSGVLFALSMIVIRVLANRVNSNTFLFYYFLYSTLFSIPFACIYWQTPTLNQLYVMVGTGVLLVLIQVFLFRSLQYAKSSHLGPFSYIAVVYAAFFDWLFWGKIPGILTLVGIALVILGGIMTIIHTRNEKSRG